MAVLASPDPWGGIDVVLAITEKEAADEAADSSADPDIPFNVSKFVRRALVLLIVEPLS